VTTVTTRDPQAWSASAALRRDASAVVLALTVAAVARAQQLEPRAYSPAPVGTNYFGLALHNSRGGVVTDAALPLDNVEADIYMTTPYYGRTFSLAGRSASVGIAAPYAWGTVSGDVFEEFLEVRRSGFGDPQLRFAVNFIGGPAMTPAEFRTRTRRTTLGFSLTTMVPVGEYDGSKLINLGTNRWAAKPELGLSFPAGSWDLELYGGVWLFADNGDFFGGQHREQEPLGTAQTHVVRTFRPGLWLAADFTYYWGGQTTVNGVRGDDRQDNTRAGLTLAVPVVGRQVVKLTWARGVSTRIGSSFQTFGVAYQWLWFDRGPRKAPS
jgi:hypothetical protein